MYPQATTSIVTGNRLTLSAAREGDLRARLCARDQQALVELIELTTPWLLGLVHGMLQDHDESEDVLLDTFRQVWDKIDPAGPTGLLPLVFRIARNKAIDRLRRRKRRTALAARWRASAVPEELMTFPETIATPHPGWQVQTQVREALGALPEEQRAVVHLAYYQGMTHGDIAAELALPLGTVKTRLRLAYTKLRASLASLREWVA